jgi:hypothetical protein
VNELKELHDFFVASVGAAAALVGLLFVAVSIAPEKIFGTTAAAVRRADAERAFTALSNVFFVSLAALTPHGPLSAIAVIAALAMAQIVLTALRLRRRFPGHFTWRNVGLISFAIYAFEFVSALRGVADESRADAIVYIVFGLYAYALGTAWGLLGAKDAEPAG